jgi:hypothetical protein
LDIGQNFVGYHFVNVKFFVFHCFGVLINNSTKLKAHLLKWCYRLVKKLLIDNPVSSPHNKETKEEEEEIATHTRGEHHPRPHTSTEWHDFPQHNGHNRSKGTRQGQDQPHPPQLSA